MKLAVMQPYLFPYIGYFQLIYAADLFLIYDDVAYIKRGFVNKNSVLAPSGVTKFTVPVKDASQNKLFSELEFSKDVVKALKTIEYSYAKAPYFENIYPIVNKVLTFPDRSIASVCKKSFEEIFSYLNIQKDIIKSSRVDYDRSVNARDRLITLCHCFGADTYINSPGGRKLYSKEDFRDRGIDLKFVESLPAKYFQGRKEFVPGLSIIDVLMNCSPEEVESLLRSYELV